MYSNLADWDEVFERFELRFPHLIKRMVDWYPSGRDEFTVELDDGNTVIYNYMEEKARAGYVPRNDDPERDENDWLREFSYRLNKKMQEHGIDQQQLSDLTGLSTVSLSRYRNGRAIPSIYNAVIITRALECSLHDLCEF